MPIFALSVIAVGLILAVIGFTMAFRQTAFRRLIGKPRPPASSLRQPGDRDDDPLTYVLRISGTMVMVFGAVIAGMMALFNLL